MNENTNPEKRHTNQQTVIIQPKSNGVGVTGFIIALIALFLGWIPVFGWILWLLGLILSFAGIFKKPRGFAIAGLIISLIGIILLIFIFAGLTILGGTASAIETI